jgi:hypothetical protein
MMKNRFRDMVEAYGGDPKRWPDAQREAAKAFMAAHPRIAGPILADARVLDGVLDERHATPSDNSLLMARILKAAQTTPQDRADLLVAAHDIPHEVGQGLRMPPWKSLAATLLLTTGMGFVVGQTAASSSEIDQAEALLEISANYYMSDEEFGEDL